MQVALPNPVGLWALTPRTQSGFTARDLSGQGSHGATSGGVTVAPGGFGVFEQAWTFNGTSTGIINFASMHGASAATQQATLWSVIAPSSLMNYVPILESRAGGQLLGLLTSSAAGNPLTASWNNTAAEYGAATGLNLVLNEPNFCCAVFNGATTTIYLGVRGLLSSATISITATNRDMTGAWYIGWDSGGTSGALSGIYYGGGIFRGALSAAQVSSLYNALRTGEPNNITSLISGSALRRQRMRRRMRGVAAGGAFNQSLAGGLSFAGSGNRLINKGLSGGLSFTGAQVKQIVKQHLATLSFVGGIKQSITKGIAGGLSFTGSTNKATSTKLAGALSFTGSVVRGTSKALAGTLSFVGAVGRGIGKPLVASLNFVGSLGRSVSHKLSGVLSFAGTLANGHAQSINLTAVLSFTGNVNKGIGKSLAGALGFVGSLPRNIGKGLSASLSFAGGVGRSVGKGLSAMLSFNGSLLNDTAKFLMKLRRWFADE